MGQRHGTSPPERARAAETESPSPSERGSQWASQRRLCLAAMQRRAFPPRRHLTPAALVPPAQPAPGLVVASDRAPYLVLRQRMWQAVFEASPPAVAAATVQEA